MVAQRDCLRTRSRRTSSSVFAVLMPLMLTVLAGCGGSGDDGPERFDVSGTVMFDGEPVPKGVIYFQPASGNSGPQGFASIVDGEFDTSTGKGTVGGPHAARIEGTDTAGVRIFVPHFENLELPKTTTTQSFEVPASAADNLQTDAEPV